MKKEKVEKEREEYNHIIMEECQGKIEPTELKKRIQKYFPELYEKKKGFRFDTLL